jgi:predicted hotdog family 3-hydroxylacyl-ACP dehydratase
MTSRQDAAGFPPIRELMPHRGKMLLLDEVVDAGPTSVTCRVQIRSSSSFVEAGRVPGLVALEYMAQAVGAFAGLRARERGGPVRIGYLLGSRDVELSGRDFLVGDDLRVEAQHVFGDEAIGSFDCKVTRRGTVEASGRLNVYLADPKEAP